MNLSKIHVFVWLLCALISATVINGDNLDNPKLPRCCPGESIIKNDTTCVLGDSYLKTTIDCNLGAYILNKSFDLLDDYRIIDGELYLNYTAARVEPERYCLGYTAFENGSLHEVAMLCFQDPGLQISIYIKGILALISVVFLCATLYVYKIIPQLRETQDKVTIFCISCLALAFTVLGLAQTVLSQAPNMELCMTMAFLIYGFMMAYLSWLNVVIANVLKCVVLPQWKIKERKWYLLNHVYAWTIPIVLTIILVTCQHIELEIHPAIGEQACWIDVESLWLYFYIPFTLLITINLIQFATVGVALYKYSGNNLSSSRKKVLKYKCQLYFKLFILSGMTWFFEVFSHLFREWESYWFFTDAVNALHGALIFLLLIIFRKRVRRELAGKRICWCCRIPQEWNQINNTEDDGFSEETKYDNINIRSPIDCE